MSKELMNAIKADDLVKVAILCSKGDDFNQRINGLYPVIEAAKLSNDGVLLYLADQGADLHVVDIFNSSVFRELYVSPTLTCIDTLLSASIGNLNTEAVYSLVLVATTFNDKTTLRSLFSMGLKIDAHSTNIQNSVGFAIASGDMEVFHLLLAHCLNAYQLTINNMTPLLYSLAMKNTEMALMCIENNTDVHFKNMEGEDALTIAIQKNNVEVVKRLFEVPNISVPGRYRYYGGNQEIVKCLKEYFYKIDLDTGFAGT